MAEKLRRKSKGKREESTLITKILAVIAGFVFAVPLITIIFLGTIIFVNTIFLGIFVGMVLALIDMLLKGVNEALLKFLEGVKNLLGKIM